ncbi:cAMP-dependent protein kinase type II regulatory subunit [Parasteatoda tepidariorum]|uniref:cAMP-dependent protein kinase type II regulatory subunit n=1 Tax=Parasteatoda tepidariorum TaxID=114398 RepID=UPI00077FBD78|nr:cAMP-dependent protein kinase type II regulatory subunit [Parasteatoda tepidariorum]
MNRPRLEVPRELTSLLLDFTVNVLLEKPADLVDYAVSYFTKLRDEGRSNNREESVPAVTCEDEDALSEDDEIDEPPPVRKTQNQYSRRKSVFAEQYNPEDDEDDDVERLIFPKSDEQRQRLGEAVRNILLFRSLDKEQMQDVLDAMMERKVKPGDVVIKQNDDGDYFYIIDGGVYHIYVDTDQEKNKLVGKYDNAGSFGELALMYNMPRAATIEAVSDGTLWAMDRQTFRRIVLKSAFKKRKEYEKLLEGVPMLQTLEQYERMNLCDALMPKAYSDGELIIKQGDEADGMFFIEDGDCKITMLKEVDGKKEEMEVVTLTKGQYFGELALVTQKPRAASVYAVGNVKLAFLDVAAFERLLGPCMTIMSRNVDHYRKQVVELFGSEANISDLR